MSMEFIDRQKKNEKKKKPRIKRSILPGGSDVVRSGGFILQIRQLELLQEV